MQFFVTTNEPREIVVKLNHLIALEPKFFSFTLFRKALPCGDFACQNLGAERKTLDDFIASIHDNRIFQQAFNMSMNYEFGYILVSGNLNRVGERDLKAIYTTIADCEARYGFRVLFFPNEDQLLRYFLMLCLKYSQHLKPLWRFTKQSPTSEDEQIEILCGAMQCGRKTAKKILTDYKSIIRFAQAPRPKTKIMAHVHDLLNKEYKEK